MDRARSDDAAAAMLRHRQLNLITIVSSPRSLRSPSGSLILGSLILISWWLGSHILGRGGFMVMVMLRVRVRVRVRVMLRRRLKLRPSVRLTLTLPLRARVRVRVSNRLRVRLRLRLRARGWLRTCGYG